LGLSTRLIATTGYQVSDSFDQLREKLINCFQGEKTLRFMQYTLRSASEICKKGGVVTSKLSEKDFNMKYDNRRNISDITTDTGYFVSRPHKNEEECLLVRTIGNMNKVKWNEMMPTENINGISSKDKFNKIIVRILIRYIYKNPEVFGFVQGIKRVVVNNILEGLNIKVNLNYISKQKALPFIPYSIPRTVGTEEFLTGIEVKYPLFEKDLLLRRNYLQLLRNNNNNNGDSNKAKIIKP
jgi:hypothetical protein